MISEDQQIPAIDQTLRGEGIQTPPRTSLQCIAKNPAQLLCMTKNCHQVDSAMCSDNQCRCRVIHKSCFYVQIKNVIQVVQDKALHLNVLQGRINTLFDTLINNLTEIQRELLSKYQELYSEKVYSEQQRVFLSEYMLNSCSKITGDMIYKINSQINQRQEVNRVLNLTIERMIYAQQKLTKKVDQFSSHLNKTLQHMRRSIAEQKNKIFTTFFWGSSIATAIKEKNNLTAFFPQPIKQAKLLYRASQHNFGSEKFHELCENIPNVLILIKSKQDKKFGGFSATGFPTEKRQEWIVDESRKSFIFSLTNENKLELKNSLKAAWNYDLNSEYICSFGTDIVIGKEANLVNKSYTWLEYSYTNLSYRRNSEGFEKFTGSRAMQFLIEEWEVWQLSFE